MKDANPIALVDELKEVLARYIATALPIGRRYPRLAEAFREELARQTLVDGPYVEALPDFEKGPTLDAVLKKNGGFLHDSLGKLPEAGRKLHKHQHHALETAVNELKSLLVATGTGSGKTESFLYPIAHDLVSEPEPGKPGVRALLVYPMNALANDQLYYRIAPLFGRYLAEHGITFGRYTGQVKANVSRDEEEARLFGNDKLMKCLGYPDKIPANWMLTREEMLKDPPKVLITNYAMLEHLLLLPRNERLFASDALKFIVLDEIHTYHGAQATEVAFLLRKLKNRLGIKRPLQVFGTSASLADDPEADERLKEFASTLFGEDVQTVVRGKRIVHERLQQPVPHEFSLTTDEWARLGGVLEEITKLQEEERSPETWDALLQGASLSRPELENSRRMSLGPFLEPCFAANREVRRAARFLDEGGVKSFRSLADLVFDSPLEKPGEDERNLALSAVIRLGMLARDDENSFPLLPGRYHIAVNSIDGLAVLPSSGDEGWEKLKAARHHKDESGWHYPLLTCRKCGQPYIEGYDEGDRLLNRRPDANEGRAERRVFWLGKPVDHNVNDEDDDAEESGTEYKKFRLDVKTGELVASTDSVLLYAIQTEEDEEEKAWYVRKCPACGGRASGADAEIVTRMHPGNEALGSVVAQRVLESLPQGIIDNRQPRPAQGRNILAFSDNRQDAAFFAPYFERTAADIALRSAIRGVLKGRSDPLSAPQLTDRIFTLWQQDGRQALLLDANGDICTDKEKVTGLLLGAIGMEFCTPGGRRNSLEARGVVSVTYEEARLSPLRQKMLDFWPAGLPKDEGSINALIHILIETIRRERALAKFHSVSLRDDFTWRDYNQHRTFEIEGGDTNVRYKWLPPQGQKRHNRRTWYLAEQLGLPREDALVFLRYIWEVLVKPPVSFLVRYNPGFGLDGDLIRFANGDLSPLYVCKSCGLMQRHVLNSKCTAYMCRGEVEELGSREREELRRRNHYLAVYDEPNHVTMRAREHTAALSTDLREGIEREFAERRLNLLSCTTTMEMGVDLGDLEAVLNLNVPPGIANYQQRTGRAGRRAQAAPFCVTIARNTNYDQAVVRNFPNYLSATPGTPFIHLDNSELFRRHQHSVLLSYFLRHRISDSTINAPSLKHLFGEDFNKDARKEFADALHQWIEGSAGQSALQEAEALTASLPAGQRGLGSFGANLRNGFLATLTEFAYEVNERFEKYSEKMEDFAKMNDYLKAGYWQQLRKKYMEQFLVEQCSRRGLIPTYSFPVHTLSLEVIAEGRTRFPEDSDVVFSRDAILGISEYAPGADVVANGRIWESAGVAHYPKAFMPEKWYVACTECFHVDVGDVQEEIPIACSNCGSSEGRRRRKFIEPRGFITDYSQRKGRDPGTSRRRVKPADEARLIAAPRDGAFSDTGLPFVRTALLPARGNEENGLRGSLFIANRGTYGEGYYRCLKCGYAAPIKPAVPAKKGSAKKEKVGSIVRVPHTDPLTGQKCDNEQLPKAGLDFAHQFDTDVRLFRFLPSLPNPENPDERIRRFHDRLARTMAEAVRLAATQILELHAGELRAIYRLYGASGSNLEVVLYDGVPGGAGYCARLGEAGCSFVQLLQHARKLLDCPAHCDSACRACLCDYGNQRYWDSLDRKSALAWLDLLLDQNVKPAGPGQYVTWPSPSLGGLASRVSNFPEVCLVARSLVEPSGFSEDVLNQFISWLQAGKTIHVFLENKLPEKPRSQAPLTVYRRLHPYAVEGRFCLHALPKEAELDWSCLPRVFVGSEIGAPVFRQHYAAQPLLEELIGAQAETGVVDDTLQEMLRQLISVSTPCAQDVLQEGNKMGMRKLHKGEPRDLWSVFSEIRDAHVKRLAIRDPYCGARLNRPKLQSFLAAIRDTVRQVDCVDVHCRETRDRDGDVEFYLDVERSVDNLIAAAGLKSGNVIVAKLRTSGRTFHDREVDVITVSEDGCDTTHRYFLTGGIDFLMDEGAETRVFYIRIEK